MKLKAFTLAEVLVTIGIVGIVATMTMPALVSKYKTVEYTSRAKKGYNTIAVAIAEYLRVKGADLLTNTSFVNDPTNQLKTVLRVVTNSATYSSVTRKNFELHNLNDQAIAQGTYPAFSNQHFLLPDGTVISMSTRINNGTTKNTKLYSIGIDTNGAKGPNQLGRDVFLYYIVNDGYVEPWNTADCAVGQIGTGCSGKLMDDGWEMNY